ERTSRRRQLLGPAPDLAHVALMIDDHDVAGDAHLMAVGFMIVERYGGDDARLPRLRDIDDGGAEMILVRNVPDIGMGTCNGDLAGAGEIEMPEPADVVGERSLPINLVHVRFRSPASCRRDYRTLSASWLDYQSSFAPDALMIAVHLGISDLI